jgi:hypothetical protein
LDKIVEELKNFPYVLVWPIKVLTTKAAYLMRFKNYEKFAENLNIINGRLEDAMSEGILSIFNKVEPVYLTTNFSSTAGGRKFPKVFRSDKGRYKRNACSREG